MIVDVAVRIRLQLALQAQHKLGIHGAQSHGQECRTSTNPLP